MSSADSYFQKRSLVSKFLLFYLKKRPLYDLWASFYVVIGSGALLARFGKKKFSFKSTAQLISLINNNSEFQNERKIKWRSKRFERERERKVLTILSVSAADFSERTKAL